MRSKYDLTTTEREIFEMLWKFPEGINQSRLLEVFINEGRDWKRQTLNTYLSNMEDKGLIKREKRIVQALYSEAEYNNLQMKDAIDKMYGGKLGNFVAAFAKENTISQDDVEYLLNVLSEYKKENAE